MWQWLDNKKIKKREILDVHEQTCLISRAFIIMRKKTGEKILGLNKLMMRAEGKSIYFYEKYYKKILLKTLGPGIVTNLWTRGFLTDPGPG